jgi:uncharacterized protein DUF5658
MSRRLVVTAALVIASLAPWNVRAAFAQEVSNDVDATTAVLVAATPSLVRAAVDVQPAPLTRPSFRQPQIGQRSFVLPSLYASTAILQALDVHSTLTGLNRGAMEANPLLSGIGSHRGAFVAAKAGVAAGTILAARAMAKHNKMAAIATLVGINAAYAAVVSHNYKVARAGR